MESGLFRMMLKAAIGRWHGAQKEKKPATPSGPSHVDQFLGELRTISRPLRRGDYTFYEVDGSSIGSVQLIIESPRAVTIHRLWTSKPGQGKGSLVLRRLCDLADRHGVELKLKVIPIGRKPYPMNREQLVAWYQRHGFRGDRRQLIRTPRAGISLLDKPGHVLVTPETSGNKTEKDRLSGI